MNSSNNPRLLVYSADNAGIGHSSIALSVLSGMQIVYPELETLVISATGVPQRFLSMGVEVVKIPSLAPRRNVSSEIIPYKPRYMLNSSLRDCMKLRQQIIDAVFSSYSPSVVLVDHHVTGLNGELVPWLLKKIHGYIDFRCGFLSRGIISRTTELKPPLERPRRGIETIRLSEAYDRFFVLEESENLDSSFFNLSQIEEIRLKTDYIGTLICKSPEDLLSRHDVWEKLDLPEQHNLILVSIGHGHLSDLILQEIVNAFFKLRLADSYSLRIVASPYMSKQELAVLQSMYNNDSMLVCGFLDEFIDAMNHASLTICRAGYNTIAELKATGCPAIVIPEDYGSGEQTTRASRLTLPQIEVLNSANIEENLMSSMKKVLNLKLNRVRSFTDNVTAARNILERLYFAC